MPDHVGLEIEEFWVAMKVYPPEFKADAVALYLSDRARTYASVAKDLGVNRETLRLWVRQARVAGAAADGAGPAKEAPKGPAASDGALDQENKQLRSRTLCVRL